MQSLSRPPRILVAISDLFIEGVRRPEIQERMQTAKRGFQTREAEMDLGR